VSLDFICAAKQTDDSKTNADKSLPYGGSRKNKMPGSKAVLALELVKEEAK